VFSQPLEMLTQLSQAPAVARCFVGQGISYATGVSLSEGLGCAAHPLAHFEARHRDMRALFALLVAEDAFIQRGAIWSEP
jgi:hypothetical protein